ncbi:MAG: aminoglycoside phosphotransferase [Candidatus Hydrogenedentota bacterium]
MIGVDGTAPVRHGEELNISALESYLHRTVPETSGSLVIEQFPSGHSNLTYLIRLGEREWVLRRPPFGSKVKGAHDMKREYTVLERLHPVYAPAPKPVVFCDDHSVIGSDFYVMERIQGVIMRHKKPSDFPAVSPELASACCRGFVKNLATLHGLDYKAIGLDALYKGDGYVLRQAEGWAKRYEGSKTDDIAEIDRVIAWLKDHVPMDTGAVLIHNDYKFDNVVVAPEDLTRIIGVLDWEMCTIGDPLADLGTSLSYWMEPADADAFKTVQCFMTTLPGAMTRQEVANTYAEITGRDLSNILYYYILALFKLAVIVQQIYYRYKQGLTQDERFASMIVMVHLLGRKAVESIETGRM